MTTSSSADGASGRLLVGWLDAATAASYGPDAVQLWHLHGASARQRMSVRATPEVAEYSPEPWDDDGYANQLFAADASLGAEGWSLRLLTLNAVRVRQVAVRDERHPAVSPRATLSELAAITVPVQAGGTPLAAYDDDANAWVLRGDGLALTLVGRFTDPLSAQGPATHGFGFVVSAQPSRLLVVDVGGIFVIVDGHHRALRLWRSGVTVVPALVRAGTLDEFEQRGCFPPVVVLDGRAPRLADYLDDEVSVAMPMATSERILVLRAQEIEQPR